MRSKLFFLVLLIASFSSTVVSSQNRVYAKNSDVSDNLDLRAVASLFGDSNNLQDFENRLNDPKYSISNLDLNNDGMVDYLRVIESVEDRTHVVIIQAILDRDVYQDIATIDIERGVSNDVVVQIVGNSYLYGVNYIYEPIFHARPRIYSSFFLTNYRPYYSRWTWGVYPTYFVAWRPLPIFRYRSHVNIYINTNNRYNYVNVRRSHRAPVIYETRRSNGYEKIRPNYGFTQRNSNVNNRYELDQRHRSSSRVASNNSVRNSRNSALDRTVQTGGKRESARIDNNNLSRNREATSRSAGTLDRTELPRSSSTASTTDRVQRPSEQTRNQSLNSGNTATVRSARSQVKVERGDGQRRSDSRVNGSNTSSRMERSEVARGTRQTRENLSSRGSGHETAGETGRRR